MKIVIISRLIYPANAPRPVRATELAKEFARQGHDVTLYGVLGNYNYTIFEKKTGIKVKSLGSPFFARLNSDGSHSFKFIDRVLRRILGRWFEFPDCELGGNVYKSLKKESNIDLLITVAVPFSIHWGAAFSKTFCPEQFPKTWVADCGDPFMGNPFHKKPFYFKYVEKWFCRKADFLTVPIEDAKEAYYSEFTDKIRVIPQGFRFDEVDIKGNCSNNAIPTFIYAGVFYPKMRDPRPLLDYLLELNLDFKFIVYTKSSNILEPYKMKMKDKLVINNYIPRKELLIEMSKADFLLNIENNTTKQSPSKLIDYMLSNRPILSLNTSNQFDKTVLMEFFKGDYTNALRIENVDQYNISSIVQEFIKLTK